MECPKCGYLLDKRDLDCPRCAKYGQTPLSGRRARAQDHPSYLAMTILGFLLPIVALITGIVYLVRNDDVERAMGIHMIAVFFVGSILAVVLSMTFVGLAQM